jgi:selenide, water dikinase
VAVTGDIRLTELVSCGGCAAKYSAALLDDLVAALPVDADPNLLVGLAPADDAAVYRLDDERALVFTVDFFPAIVDDPRDFGAIAAANALNDVFAMGATPLVALSVAAFPESLPGEAVAAVLDGAAAKVREAGGLAVVGIVAPDAVWTKGGAQPGDVVYLTKPLGTGLVVHGRKDGRVSDEVLAQAVALMTTLNAEAAAVVRAAGPHAVTDVTGFGLVGHAYELASRSGVRLELDAGALPVIPAALELARAGVVTGGDRRNREYVGDALETVGVSAEQLTVAFDPQTAGGLLVALPPDKSFAATRIGAVTDGEGIRLYA